MSTEARLCVIERDVQELRTHRVDDGRRMDRFEAVLQRMENRQIRVEQVQAEHSAQLVELRDLVSAGIRRADDHAEQLAGLRSDVTGLKTDVTDLKTDVTGLKTDVTDLKTDVTGLKTGMGTLTEMVQQLLDRSA